MPGIIGTYQRIIKYTAATQLTSSTMCGITKLHPMLFLQQLRQPQLTSSSTIIFGMMIPE